jgi:uncharacterized protein YkwD
MHWLAIFFQIWFGAAGPPGSPDAALSPLEAGVAAEVNRLRQDPPAYGRWLEAQRRFYRDNVLRLPGIMAVMTDEGAAALDEAVAVLVASKPAGPLVLSEGLCLAAADHVADQGQGIQIGHRGSDASNPSARAGRYSVGPAAVGEIIVYGPWDAAAAVLRFVVDDGVPDRGHRRNLLRADYRYMGVACGPHAAYHGMCVVDFAREYAENPVAVMAAGRRPLRAALR